MKRNVGGNDRKARYFLGGAGIAFALLAPVSLPWKLFSGVMGALGLTTAATGYCPANALLNVDTSLPIDFADVEEEHQLTLNYR